MSRTTALRNVPRPTNSIAQMIVNGRMKNLGSRNLVTRIVAARSAITDTSEAAAQSSSDETPPPLRATSVLTAVARTVRQLCVPTLPVADIKPSCYKSTRPDIVIGVQAGLMVQFHKELAVKYGVSFVQ
jgi:hypothetical protein